MNYTLSELKRKEVVDTHSGIMLGRVDDVEIDGKDSSIKSMIVFGRPRLLGLFGRDEDIIIRSSQISLVGRDAILVDMDNTLSDMSIKHPKETKILYK